MKLNQKSFIVVAEDDVDDRFLIKIAFEQIFPDLDLNFVNNGEELLFLLDQTTTDASIIMPDLIILDLNMPKMSGHQALLQIKKKAEFDSIEIAVLSTSAEQADIEFCKKQGVRSFYTKPDSFETLVSIIKSIVVSTVLNHKESSNADIT